MTYILLIEDHDPDAESIKRLLRGPGAEQFSISRAKTLAEGLAKLSIQPRPDIVLLDLTLPDSHRSVSASSVLSHASDIPVIVLTGYADEKSALEIVQLGVMDFLVKDDLNQQVLVRSMRYAIERSRMLVELRVANRELAVVNSDLEQRVEARTLQVQKMEEAARLQQAELAHAARLNLLGELSAGLAHELNQPLMAIAAFSNSAHRRVANRDGDDEVLPLLSDISSEATRAGEIIRRLRNMVQRRTPQLTQVSISQLIDETLVLVRHEFKSRQTQFVWDGLGGDTEIRTDSIQLQQVLINLFQNALRETSKLSVEVREITLTVAVAEHDVAIRIANPTSESPDNSSEWFDPFMTKSEEGLGLGLPISRRITESLNGQLTVETSGNSVTMMVTLRHVDG